MSTPGSGENLYDAAWGIIANVGQGDWSGQTQEWQDAAANWRAAYDQLIANSDVIPSSHH